MSDPKLKFKLILEDENGHVPIALHGEYSRPLGVTDLSGNVPAFQIRDVAFAVQRLEWKPSPMSKGSIQEIVGNIGR